MNIKNKLFSLLGHRYLNEITRNLQDVNYNTRAYIIEDYLDKFLYRNIRYIKNKRITQYYNSIYSQNGEDGLIEEIFRRIGTTNKYFMEFGVHSYKNNTTFLLVSGWEGVWIEGSNEKFVTLQLKLSTKDMIRLKYINAFITKDTFKQVLVDYNIPNSIDLLSIDIDGNDFYIFKTLKSFRPRVVIIEYNASLGPSKSLVMEYNTNFHWKGGNYFGASLKALEKLGAEMGYMLVGCDFSGTNAFFVDQDCVKNHFEEPFTSENHYEPPRYFLRKTSSTNLDIGNYLEY